MPSDRRRRADPGRHWKPRWPSSWSKGANTPRRWSTWPTRGATPITRTCASSSALLLQSDVASQRGDWEGADQACRLAIAVAAESNLCRELAEAYFSYAHVMGSAADAKAELAAAQSESPASWLARAQELYR